MFLLTIIAILALIWFASKTVIFAILIIGGTALILRFIGTSPFMAFGGLAAVCCVGVILWSIKDSNGHWFDVTQRTVQTVAHPHQAERQPVKVVASPKPTAIRKVTVRQATTRQTVAKRPAVKAEVTPAPYYDEHTAMRLAALRK